MEKILVIKKSGAQEEFSESKVIRSMQRAGLPGELQPMVLDHIKKRLHPHITTLEIYSHILEFLKEKHQESSVRFNLKKSIFDLGPTGFPFEKYMEKIFQSMGYHTATDIMMEGECVTHEIDILLEKDGKKEIVEVKFHNTQGIKTDVQVLLYTYARFLDVREKNNIEKVWVVTNTKLTLDSIKYSECKQIPVIAWNYPGKGNLQEYVEKPGLYPITILDALTAQEKAQLVQNKIVVISDFITVTDEELENKYYIDQVRIKQAKDQVAMVYPKVHT